MYGGTKAELQRLIEDASTYTDIQKEMGVVVDASSLSFDNIINAISVIQGKLGIAGATALEASTTIEGSTNSMKAAWKNLVTGIADDNADFDRLVDNFVESVGTVGDNLLPRIEIALGGVGKLVEGLAPVISNALPTLVKKVVPPLISSASNLLQTFGEALLDNADLILDSALDVGLALVDGIIDFAPELISGAGQLIGKVVPAIVKRIPDITASLMTGIVNGAYDIVEQFGFAILGIPDKVGELKEQISAKGNVFESFQDSVANAGTTMVDMSQLLSESGKTIAEIESKYQEVESNITRILGNALSEQRTLRQSELEDIAGYNKQLKQLLDQKLEVYTSQIQAEGTKLKIGFPDLDYEELAESKSRLDAYLTEASKALDEAYSTDLANLQNYYSALGLLESRAYQSSLEAAQINYEQQKSEIEDYYVDALSVIGEKTSEMASGAASGLESVAEKQRLAFGDAYDAQSEYMSGLEILYSRYADSVYGISESYAKVLNDVDEQSYNALLSVAARIKKGGGEISGQSERDIAEFLSLFENVPPNMEGVAHEALARMTSGIETEIPALSNAASMTSGEIVSVLRRELLEGQIAEITGGMASLIRDGLTVSASDATGWGEDLVDNYTSGIKSRKSRLIEEVAGLAKGMKDYIGFSEPEKGPLSNFHTYAPDMMELFAKGIRENENVVYRQLEKSFDFDNRLGTVSYGTSAGYVAQGGQSARVVNLGGVTINVSGGSDDSNTLARKIAIELQNMYDEVIASYG